MSRSVAYCHSTLAPAKNPCQRSISGLAEKVGVSRQWIIEIEKGKPRAAIGLILRTLNALGIFLDARNEPAQKAKPSAHEVDLDALIEAARKPRRKRSVISRRKLEPS